MTDCLFCRIATGEIPARVVSEDEDLMAFHDVAPQSPVHVLVIPKRHYANLAEVAGADPALTSRLVLRATEVATGLGVAGSGYRVVANTGAEGGQTVDHVHLHVLGGRRMGWPPG